MSENAAILLVDDREENLIALEAVLAPLGHHLVRADSGSELASFRETGDGPKGLIDGSKSTP